MDWFTKSGFLFPFIGKRKIPINRDGSVFDSGELDMLDEKAPFYVEIWAIEWLGFGIPVWPWGIIRDSITGEPVE